MVANASFVSPTADAKFAQKINQFDTNGIVSTLLSGVNGWTITLTVFLMLVAYDQCKLETLQLCLRECTNNSTVKYIWNKGSIVGPTFKTPFIGPFLQSMNPKFGEYHAKWLSGPLSCVSVFHK